MKSVSQRDREIDRIYNRVEHAVEILGKFDKLLIGDLLRRGEVTNEVDGFPPGGAGSGGGDTAYSDPTSSAATVRMAQTESDPIGEALDELFGTLQEITSAAKRVNRLRSVVVNAGSKMKERAGLPHCNACGRQILDDGKDRKVNGYCDTCRMAWTRAGRPDRPTFERERRKQLDDEGGDRSIMGGIGGYEVDDIDLLQDTGVLPKQ